MTYGDLYYLLETIPGICREDARGRGDTSHEDSVLTMLLLRRRILLNETARIIDFGNLGSSDD